MDLEHARQTATTLMRQHGLKGWVFGFDRAVRRNGMCDYGKRKISLSRYFVELNSPEMVKETILHEIAHVIAGPGTGHGPEWKRVAVKLGVRPQAAKRTSMPEGKWHGVCPCGYPHRMFRKPRTVKRCITCYGVIRWVDSSLSRQKG